MRITPYITSARNVISEETKLIINEVKARHPGSEHTQPALCNALPHRMYAIQSK